MPRPRISPSSVSTRRYDLIVVTNVFPYLSDSELLLAMSNIARMLNPGGILIHNEPRPVLAEALLASDAAAAESVWRGRHVWTEVLRCTTRHGCTLRRLTNKPQRENISTESEDLLIAAATAHHRPGLIPSIGIGRQVDPVVVFMDVELRTTFAPSELHARSCVVVRELGPLVDPSGSRAVSDAGTPLRAIVPILVMPTTLARLHRDQEE